MATAPTIAFADLDLDLLASQEGVLVAFWRPGSDGAGPQLQGAASEIDRLSAGQAKRAAAAQDGDRGDIAVISAPHGLAADTVVLACLGDKPITAIQARRLGGNLVKRLAAAKARDAQVFLDAVEDAEIAAEVALGLSLRGYRFDAHKSEPSKERFDQATLRSTDAAALEAAFAPRLGLAAGVALTRDLVNEPANVLFPAEFARRIEAMSSDGLEIEVMGEDRLAELGMRTLLAVGRGSRKESKVAVMRWNGAADATAAPICLVGKGVCFDTGGISLKPAAGMEEMTMDMGGAGVVAGVMKAVALRKSKANVLGIVGLVENMPDGDATRPGDIVTSMSGKTIEVINTDAEGRLVLADLLHHVQNQYKPKAMVDLATLTGAVIIALGHENAGLFANDDPWADALLAAAKAEGEGLWRMPLGDAYDKQLKSRLADMKNVGGRPAGSITAAQFLQRFVKDDVPWAHIDIAGVCVPKEDGATWPKGPSGWGVATLVRVVEEAFA